MGILANHTAVGCAHKRVSDLTGYKNLMESLYFLFRESVGQRLGATIPPSFADVNTLRTDRQHDVDHGDKGKIKSKKKKIGPI